MTDVTLTPEMSHAACAVSARLQGYAHDIEDTINEMADEGKIPWGYHQAPRGFFMLLDQKAWKCRQCDIWHPPAELNKNDDCSGCAQGEPFDEDDQ